MNIRLSMVLLKVRGYVNFGFGLLMCLLKIGRLVEFFIIVCDFISC